MLSPLRAEMNALLAETPVSRKPALRRASHPEGLLATDLPHAAEAAAVEGFVARAQAQGWQISDLDNGWLLLDKPVPAPDVTVPDAGGEAGCCLSLLLRHPDGGAAQRYIREVVRAEEAGAQQLERLCEALHAELAALLRLHQPMPGALLPYLAHACQTHLTGRK